MLSAQSKVSLIQVYSTNFMVGSYLICRARVIRRFEAHSGVASSLRSNIYPTFYFIVFVFVLAG